MSSSRISVIIPAYNVGPYLAETIRSVMAQTRSADEIIVVDDCSTDDTLSVARSTSDPRYKVMSTGKNSGSAVARNLGINAATGDLIALLDGDDFWLEHHLERVAGLLDAHPAAALAFSATEAFGTEQWIWPMVLNDNEPVSCFWQCIIRTIIPQMNVVVRRDSFLAVGGYRPQMRQTQDFDLFLRMSYLHPFICTHEVTTKYRRHAESITRRRPKNAMHGQYISRFRFWEENKDRMDPETLAKFEAAVREIWVGHITACANRLDFEMLHFHLDQHALIPGTAEPYQKWLHIRKIEWIKPIWELLPLPMRQVIKRVTFTHNKSHY